MENIEDTKVETPDLEKIRDERCFPIARLILKEMAPSLVSASADTVNYDDLVLKSLSLFLGADLNVTTETPYITQLLLGVFSGLNRTIHECTVIPIDDARYSSIASKILQIVSDGNVRLGSVTPEESIEDFTIIKVKLNELFAEEKLNLLEVRYIMDNMFDAFKDFSDKYSESIESSVKRSELKLFGVNNMNEVSLKQLDGILKA